MKYSIKEGWKLNPNKGVVKAITKLLERNGGICPCVHDEDYKDEDLKCPCFDYRVNNKCCCQLYIKENEIS